MLLRMPVQQIIRECGGAVKVAAASQETPNPITSEAVFKWYRNGIPEDHWPLVMRLSGRKLEDVYNANRVVEERSKRQSHVVDERGKRRSRTMAAA
jgi:hypothetical protein